MATETRQLADLTPSPHEREGWDKGYYYALGRIRQHVLRGDQAAVRRDAGLDPGLTQPVPAMLLETCGSVTYRNGVYEVSLRPMDHEQFGYQSYAIPVPSWRARLAEWCLRGTRKRGKW